MSSFLMPMSLVRVSPAMRALYSDSLLVAQKPHWMAYWIKSPLGEVWTKPILDPLMLLESSTKSIHLDVECYVRLSNSLSAYGIVFGVKSAMKSANTYDLSAVHGWKVMSCSLISTAHLVSFVKSLGLCRMLFKG